ncbi:potassium transporter TrkH, partial [Vibrio lentus]
MVNVRPILFVLGLVLSKLALFMYPPTILAIFNPGSGFVEFAQAIVITHLVSFICLSFGRTKQFKLNVRDVFLVTTLVW